MELNLPPKLVEKLVLVCKFLKKTIYKKCNQSFTNKIKEVAQQHWSKVKTSVLGGFQNPRPELDRVSSQFSSTGTGNSLILDFLLLKNAKPVGFCS
jgi:hypothetical protein